ncbi:hypothetical protein AX769_21265 (plasmid) [Frondihabitans sp. PAMC 28766]|nr:hypothetical protein AX769_21265 [Frondihabitans sp. PAMC 28766]
MSLRCRDNRPPRTTPVTTTSDSSLALTAIDGETGTIVNVRREEELGVDGRRWPMVDQCTVDGCGGRASFPAPEYVTLDDGDTFPWPLCDEHTLAYLHH